MYQSAVQIFISFVFLGLYTIAINTMNPGGELDFIEGLLYIFTLGYIVDEAIKFWKVGTSYFGNSPNARATTVKIFAHLHRLLECFQHVALLHSDILFRDPLDCPRL